MGAFYNVPSPWMTIKAEHNTCALVVGNTPTLAQDYDAQRVSLSYQCFEFNSSLCHV